MCERFCSISSLKIIEKEFKVSGDKIKKQFHPNLNTGLGESALVITSEAPKELQYFRFGFTPFWARKKKKILTAPINGEHNKYVMPERLQSIFRKAMFRLAIRERRCLVIANAFYVGIGKDKLKKPYLVYREATTVPFAFAGLWDEWIDDDQNTMYSFAIVTTPPSELLKQFGQSKSPLILNKSTQEKWLDPQATPREINALLQPMNDQKFNAYRVSSRIRKIGNKNPNLLKPKDIRVRAGSNFDFFQQMDLSNLKDYTKRTKK